MNEERYLVIELQVAVDGTLSQLSTIYTSEADAMSKFHTILAAAALTTLPVHGAVILLRDGTLYDRKAFYRPLPETAEEGGEGNVGE